MRSPAALASALLLLTTQARADHTTAAVWDRPFAIAGRVDLVPFPLSDALVTLEVAPWRALSLEVGAGASVPQHPLFEAALHLQLPLGKWAPGLEAGFLTGPFRWPPGASTNGLVIYSDEIGYFHDERLDNAVFVRAGLSLGFRSNHFHLRIHAGITALPNREGTYCHGDDGRLFAGCHLKGIPAALPYLGTTFGYAFGP